MPKHIPAEIIQDILSRIDIVEIIDARVPLKKTGNNYVACCPFHQEKSPSFTVNNHKQFYHCFGCGAHGNAINFLIDYDNLEFVEAVELLADHAGIHIQYTQTESAPNYQEDYTILNKASQFYKNQLQGYPFAQKYLEDRGIKKSTQEYFLLGYASGKGLIQNINTNIQKLITLGLITEKNNNYYEKFWQRLIFPIRNKQGHIIAFGGRILGEGLPKYLNSPESDLFHKSKELYGLYEARQTKQLKRLIIVEGYIDVLSLWQAGFTETVAALGTAISQHHIQQMLKLVSEIIFCFDGDQAGQKAAWKALETSFSLVKDQHKIRFLILPQQEDPDSIIQKQGIQTFQEYLDQAIDIAEFFSYSLEKKFTIHSLEGRRQVMEFAQPLLNTLKAPYLLAQLQDRLGQMSSLPVAKPKKIQTQDNIQVTTMRLANVLLLHNPQLCQKYPLTEELIHYQANGMDLLHDLVTFIDHHPQTNTANILEYWRETHTAKIIHKLLEKLSNIPELVNQTSQEQAWQGCLNKLSQKAIQQRTDILLDKAKQGLSTQEKQELHDLLLKKNKYR